MPPHPAMAGGDVQVIDAGQPLCVDVGGRPFKAWSFSDDDSRLSDGDLVAGQCASLRGPTVVLMHGWGGYGGQLAGFIAPLVAVGRRVIVFDAFGHGRSPASLTGFRQATFFDFRDALDAIRATVGPIDGLVAHSGGALAATLALRGGLDVRRLVLLAPMSRPAIYAANYSRMLGFSADVTARWQALATARLGMSFADLDATRPGFEPPATLVVHDWRDREVPFSDGEALAHAWQAQLVPTENLGHRRILHDPAVIRRAVDFLAPRNPRGH